MTREDFLRHIQLENDQDKWLDPRDYRGVNKVWQVIGDKHKEYRRFGVVGGWRKKWFIVCHCIDKDVVYRTEKFESTTGNEAAINPIWDNEIHQWISKHTGDTFNSMNYGTFVSDIKVVKLDHSVLSVSARLKPRGCSPFTIVLYSP